jgi:hypothetical protein
MAVATRMRGMSVRRPVESAIRVSGATCGSSEDLFHVELSIPPRR